VRRYSARRAIEDAVRARFNLWSELDPRPHSRPRAVKWSWLN